MRGRRNMSSRAMSRRSSRRSSNPSSRGGIFQRRNSRRLHPEQHLARVAALQIAVSRHRPEREELRVAVIAKKKDAGKTGRGEARLVPEATGPLLFDEISQPALDSGMIASAHRHKP